MKKLSVFLILYSWLFSQDLLPLIWKAENKDLSFLLSWERQGYFWQTERQVLSNEFLLPDLNRDYELIINLRCTVHDIRINDNRILANIINKFNWDDPADLAAERSFVLPKSILKQKNSIKLYLSDFQYTGGKSYNYCQIRPRGSEIKSYLHIHFPNKNHVFLNHEQPKLTIRYHSDVAGKIQLIINSDFHEQVAVLDTIARKGEYEIDLDLTGYHLQPGIYECISYLHDSGHYGEVQWFTISPEEIRCTNHKPDHFDEFWKSALAELSITKPHFKIHKTDSLQSALRDGYVVEMNSLGNVTIRGYYFVPKTPGPHAVILHLPGMGYGFQHHGAFLDNSENVAELALCVRNHGIADEVVPVWGIPGQWGTALCDPENYSYRGLYMDCVRALEFLESRPEIDPARIGCDGGSQGGGLTLMLAGLCPDRINAAAYFDPFPCDVKDAMKIRSIMVREIQNFIDFYSDCDWVKALVTLDLHDTKHFAESIQCPVYFSAGLFDDDCPPHIGFAAYNLIASEKKYTVEPQDSHIGESGYSRVFMKFFKEKLNF
ncbi:MAG: acetylxylan esterase [Candidatus Marinimicrobia bacterium]|nr:acetylxylan esterase [Candidatus Neomarinimicrobiota bacterium]